MQFEPKTREQAEKDSQFPVWEEGIYGFEVAKAEAATSKKGNEMIKLTLNVQNDEGHSQIIFDYITSIMALKLLDACEAMGLLDNYESGKLEPWQFEGKIGELRLIIRPETRDKEAGKVYSPKNEVKTYIPNSGRKNNPPVQARDKDFVPDLRDEIPF